MSTPCRPCDLLVCEVPNDLLVYDLDGFPPQPLPPVVPPVPPSYGNQTLYWCCSVEDVPAFPDVPAIPSDPVL